MALATSTQEIEVCATSTACISTAPGASIYSNPDYDGWDIGIVFGTSHSPNGNPELDVTSVTASCDTGTACATLDILFSDTGFTGSSGLATTYSATDTGGTTSESAYYSTSNALFAETTLIGAVGPFSSPGGVGTIAGGGTPGSTPYSLTLDQVFNDSNGGNVTFSVDGNITTPEPTSIVLFGTILSLGGFALRRKLKKNS
jgi:hypothetical protein